PNVVWLLPVRRDVGVLLFARYGTFVEIAPCDLGFSGRTGEDGAVACQSPETADGVVSTARRTSSSTRRRNPGAWRTGPRRSRWFSSATSARRRNASRRHGAPAARTHGPTPPP